MKKRERERNKECSLDLNKVQPWKQGPHNRAGESQSEGATISQIIKQKEDGVLSSLYSSTLHNAQYSV